MYQQEDYLPINRNYFILIGCFTFIFTVIIIFTLIKTQVKAPEKVTIVKQSETTYPMADLTKYNQDSDQDILPNFIEDEAILNTYVNEVVYCEGSNPKCSESPFKESTYINILIDSSTSMNIPAREKLSKLELVKSDLQKLLIDTIFEPFARIQFTGFGNKGNTNFIADNESCVSNLVFKNFEQKLVKEESSATVLKNLVANGKSPIVYSLEQAEKSFQNKSGNNLIIIITDGVDDCGAETNGAIKALLSRGVVKKVNIISLFSPEDENQKLRESAESNGGKFSATSSIYETIKNWEKDFIKDNWCKSQAQNNIYQCLNNNYSKAFAELEKLITTTSPQNELNKIKEIKSSSDLYLQNYKLMQNTELDKEFEELFKEIVKK